MRTERGARGDASRRRIRRAGSAAVLVASVLLAGCGGDDGDDAAIDDSPAPPSPSTTVAATGPECSSGRPAVVVDFGMATHSIDEIVQWFDGTGPVAVPRPGAAEWLQAYRQRGYDVIYLSSIPADRLAAGEPVMDVVNRWLTDNGFPIGDGSHVVLWDLNVTDQVSVYKTQVLLDLATNGTTAYWGYADDEIDMRAMRNAGIPADRIYTLGEVAGIEGTIAAPGAETDWTQHRTTVVDPMPAACTA